MSWTDNVFGFLSRIVLVLSDLSSTNNTKDDVNGRIDFLTVWSVLYHVVELLCDLILCRSSQGL